MLGKRRFRNVIPSEVEGSFSLAVRGSVPDSEKWETLYRRKGGDGASPKRLSEGGGKRETKKISRCARNDSVGNGYLVHHAKKECVGNAFFPYRHPERSRGIFFVGGKRASAWQRETGNAVSRKGEDGASPKRLSEGVMEKRDEKDFYLRLKQCGGRSFLIEFIYVFFVRFL